MDKYDKRTDFWSREEESQKQLKHYLTQYSFQRTGDRVTFPDLAQHIMNVVLRRGDLELWQKTSAKSTYRFLMLDQEKISFRNRYPRYVTYFIVATYGDRVVKVFEESLQEENDTQGYRKIKSKFQEIIAL